MLSAMVYCVPSWQPRWETVYSRSFSLLHSKTCTSVRYVMLPTRDRDRGRVALHPLQSASTHEEDSGNHVACQHNARRCRSKQWWIGYGVQQRRRDLAMARMYPQRLSDFVQSSAERTLYNQFAVQLPDAFIVMHSVKWLMRDRHHHDHDGEIDFLIIHPDLGLLILEVKGGRIRVDGSSGQWYTKNRFGEEAPLKMSPFDQARENLYNLRRKLAEAPATRPFTYRMQRGIALPDVTIGSIDIGLYGDRDLIIDATDLPRLEASVRRILGTSNGDTALGATAVKALVDTVQPTIEISRLGLSTHILQAEERIATLTEQQFLILDALQLRPQAAVAGCAGSGKTMLALEKARRLAAEGFTVLFTCFNRNLAHWVRTRIARDPHVVSERIYVGHYHGLVIDLCRRAGVVLSPLAAVEPTARTTYLNETLPQQLHEAIARLPIRFDAIIADEGQDFAELWWLTLTDLLRDREHGVFYIFYDNNQRIYPHDIALPFADLPFPLNVNCRNTDRIHSLVAQYYQGAPKPRSRGPEGLEPEFVPHLPGGELETLRRVFARLFTEERLQPSAVVLLTSRSARTSIFAEGTRLGNVMLTWSSQPGPGQVQVCSIYSFKGLESPIVILGELNRIGPDAPRDYLLYVAASRPRDHLIVLGEIPHPLDQPQALRPDERWSFEAEALLEP